MRFTNLVLLSTYSYPNVESVCLFHWILNTKEKVQQERNRLRTESRKSSQMPEQKPFNSY